MPEQFTPSPRQAEQIKKLCLIQADVVKYFHYEYAGDCVCASMPEGWNQTNEDRIHDFIREAVEEKMAREGPPISRYVHACAQDEEFVSWLNRDGELMHARILTDGEPKWDGGFICKAEHGCRALKAMLEEAY